MVVHIRHSIRRGPDDTCSVLVGRPHLGETEKANAIIHFKVTPFWRDMIQEDAASQNMCLSEYLRDLILRRHMELRNNRGTI